MTPTFIQKDPSIQRRQRLADAMTQQASQYRPIQHPLQGVGQLAQALSGAYQQRGIDRDITERTGAYNKTIADALEAYGGTPATTAPFVPDTFDESDVLPAGLETEVPAQPGGMDELARVLAQNPDTSGLALDFKLKGIEADRAERLAGQKYQRAREDKRADLLFSDELARGRDADKIAAKAQTPGADIVQSSDILPDGTVVQVFKSGEVKTVTQEEDNVQKIKDARRYGAEIQGVRSGERTAASEGQKQSVKAFTGLVKARTNIANIDKAIEAIDQGASTGFIQSMLPSVQEASIKLDNLQNSLGLDVIGNVTFGALSKGELDLALSTALPTSLEPEALRRWLVDKRTAQAKLADYLQETAVYLGTPGNSIAKFLQEKKIATGGDTPLTPEEKAELEELRILKRERQ